MACFICGSVRAARCFLVLGGVEARLPSRRIAPRGTAAVKGGDEPGR